MDAQILFCSKFIDNPLLISNFQRITKIVSKSTDISVSSASKLVNRFRSLSQIQIRVYSLDICVSILDLFVCQLAKLSYVEVYFTKNTLGKYRFTRAYVVKKRRERFPNEELDEQMVHVLKAPKAVFLSLS